MTNVDTIVEGDQEFIVSLVEVNSDPVNLVLISTPSEQSVTIQDNIGTYDVLTLRMYHGQRCIFVSCLKGTFKLPLTACV